MKKIGIVLGGIVAIIVGIYLIVTGNALAKRCTTEAIGTVVEIKQESSIDDNGNNVYTYYPVIEYKVGGETITKQSPHGSNQSQYKINEKVDILYNPAKTDEYIIKGDKSSNIIGIIFIVLGAVVALIGLVKMV